MKIGMLLFAVASFPYVAHATLPATADQTLCHDESDNFVVAHVDHETSEDCRLKYKTSCQPDALVRLSIVIDEVSSILWQRPALRDGVGALFKNLGDEHTSNVSHLRVYDSIACPAQNDAIDRVDGVCFLGSGQSR